jgi:hypothetical protein
MPKRSNEFQRLVAVIQSHLAVGCSVEESKLLVDRLTGALREVDVFIEGKIGSNKVGISIECRDHSRPQSVSWIDEMKAKHERLETHVLVLFSRSGFSKQANAAAEKYGIKLVSQEDIARQRAEFHFSLDEYWIKTVSTRTERVELFVEIIDHSETAQVSGVPEIQLFNTEQKEEILLGNFVNKLLYSGNVGTPLLDNAKEEHSHFEVVWNAPFLDFKELYLHNTVWAQYHRLAKVRIVGTCKTIIQSFGVRGALFDGAHVVWGNTQMLDNNVLVAGTKDSGGTVRWSLRANEWNRD